MTRRLLFGVGLISILLLALFLVRQRIAPKRVTEEEYPPHLAFFPSTVSSLKWKVGNQEFDYFRNKKDAAQWSPATDRENVEERLLVMAQSWGKAYTESSEPIVSVVLGFINGETWEGHWDGITFQWDTGPKAGEGAKLNAHQAAYFQAGKLSFENRKYLICLDSVEGIRISKKGAPAYEIQRLRGQWSVKNEKGSSVSLPPTYYEEWLGRNCQIQADHNIDTDIRKVQVKPDVTVELEMHEKKSLSFEIAEGNLIRYPLGETERWIVATGWQSRWSDLLNHLDSALSK